MEGEIKRLDGVINEIYAQLQRGSASTGYSGASFADESQGPRPTAPVPYAPKPQETVTDPDTVPITPTPNYVREELNKRGKP
jgi:hypothetical protein